ncbi:hypothetical protein SEUCBS139899_005234 [Sporothrix eucalyptigena]|uniref:Molybdopterin synthase catalytic subunit n=1 Tax=Sporothrix eucalyptigena TaxID=1812306 RepID=A0ABP0BII2_9PEZI
MAQEPATEQDSLTADGCYVALTEAPLDVAALLNRVRSPKAGANVLFAGSTRDSFEGRSVATLRYASYRPLALRTMLSIASDVRVAHDLVAIAVVHRLGPVPIGEDSILIAVSAPHRQAAWRAGEACLERVKERVEIWKEEVFVAAEQTEEDGNSEAAAGESVWRSNRDPKAGARTVISEARLQKPIDDQKTSS